MKIDAYPYAVKVEPALLKELVKEVKETVAPGFAMEEVKKTAFTLAELWNIRSKARTAGSRLYR